MQAWLKKMSQWISRRRQQVIDGGALFVLTLLLLYYALEDDIFVDSDSQGHLFESDKDMLIAAVFATGLVVFMLRRLAEARRETERRFAAEREARTLALHDPMTGLANRRQFEEMLAAAVAAPPRSTGSHVLMLLDLNGFKHVNDVFGHQTGDEVLVQVGGRLSRVVRDGDLVARIGGDEFAVLAQHSSGAEAATGLALRIMEAIDQPILAGGVEHRIGVAVGISLTPQNAGDTFELMRQADIALYRAKAEKATTGSAMRFFEAVMDDQVREREQLERELRDALRHVRIVTFYQPLIRLDGGRVTGFEALARWTSPTLGPIEPTRFVALAEDVGLIGQMTERLLARACRDAMTWPADVTLAVNISGATLQDRALGMKIVQILAQTGLAPSRLELEITESALVRDLEAARTTLGSLRSLGVCIALDDFGTGYSSPYHLRTFKPDKIKIDRSFVDGMENDPDNAAIVQALIGLGSGLGATITAEGVETRAQLNLLRLQGCDQGQGYLFSRAVDAGAALALVDASQDLRMSA